MKNTIADRELPHEVEQVIRSEAYRTLTEICPDDFEDLCQEGRIAVLLSGNVIDDADNGLAMCRTIARRRMANWLRAERRHSDHQVPIPDGL